MSHWGVGNSICWVEYFSNFLRSICWSKEEGQFNRSSRPTGLTEERGRRNRLLRADAKVCHRTPKLGTVFVKSLKGIFLNLFVKFLGFNSSCFQKGESGCQKSFQKKTLKLLETLDLLGQNVDDYFCSAMFIYVTQWAKYLTTTWSGAFNKLELHLCLLILK